MEKTKIRFSIGVLIVSLIMFIGTFAIKITPNMAVSAAAFPRLILGITAILAVIYMIPAFKELKNKAGKEEKKDKGNINGLYLTGILFIAYAVLLDVLGFIITSIVYLIIQMWIMYEEKDKKALPKFALISVISVVFIYFLFTKAFFVSLPSGSIF